MELIILSLTAAILIAPPPEGALLFRNFELIMVAPPGFISIAPPHELALLFVKVESIITESYLITTAPPLPFLPFLKVSDDKTTFEFKVKIT